MNVERFHEKTDFPSGFEGLVVLHHGFVALVSQQTIHFVMHAFEDGGVTVPIGWAAAEIEYIDVFGTDDYIDRSVFAKNT